MRILRFRIPNTGFKGGLLFLPGAGNTDLDNDPVDGLTRLGLRTEHGEHSRILSGFRDQTKDPIQANF
jgi:hypothetical protein